MHASFVLSQAELCLPELLSWMPALMTKKKGEKSEKAEASAVAKPKGGKTHDVSVDERDDQPSDELPEWADSKHEAGTKDESAQSSG